MRTSATRPSNLYKHTQKVVPIYIGNTFPKREKTYYNWINEETDMPISFLIKMKLMFRTTADYLLEGSTGYEAADASIGGR